MHRRRLLVALLWLATAYPVALLVLSIQQLLAPQRNGLLAIGQVAAPHLFLAALPLVPLLFVGRARAVGEARRALGGSLAVLLVVGLVRFLPGMVSLPPEPDPDGVRLSLTSWNRQALDGPSADVVLAAIRRSPSDLVVIQELRFDDVARIEADPGLSARYPYRLLRPHGGTFGMGLLSAHPIVDEGWRDVPHTVWARVQLAAGDSLVVVNVHPLPGSITTLEAVPIPVGYDTDERDAAIGRLRAELVDPLLAQGEPLILVGDMNTTVREPVYARLASGLVDVHASVGWGPGSTWRPDGLDRLPLGLLRIDHVLTGPGVRPLSIDTDCTSRGSDHCLVHTVLEAEP